MANKIQKHWIALSKTKMLLRYLEKGNRIYDYKNMEAFYIRAKIIRQLTSHKVCSRSLTITWNTWK